MIPFLMFMVTGCWDNVELTERAFISGVGLDKTTDDEIELTLQLTKPSEVSQEQDTKTGKEPVWTNTSRGETLHEAVRNQFTTVNRKPYYSHIQIIVIGETLARDGIKDVLDFFERDHETSLTPMVIIAKGTTAKNILNAKSDLENVPASHIRQIVEASNVNLAILKSQLIDVLKQLSSAGHGLTTSVIEIVNEDTDLNIKDMKIEGAAVFEKDTLIGWLSPCETKGLKYLLNKSGSGIINIDNPLDREKMIAIEQLRAKSKIDVRIKDENTLLLVEVKSEGTIGNQEGIGDLSTQEMIDILEEETADVIKQEIHHVITKAQKEYKNDIFGFGEVVHRKYLGAWREIKNNWDEVFSTTPIQVEVTFKLNNTGIIEKTLEVR